MTATLAALILVKSSLILAGVLTATRFLIRRSAALRHSIILAGMLSAAAIPLLTFMAPDWNVLPLDPDFFARIERPASTVVITLPARVLPETARSGETAPAPATPGEPALASLTISWIAVIAVTWLAGMLGLLGILVVGSLALRRAIRHARPLAAGPWVDAAREIEELYGLNHPSLLFVSLRSSMLATWGFRRATILLPAEAEDWPAPRIRAVLTHELAHARRADWMAQMTAQVLRAIYWFNPLFWTAARRLRSESEMACDDAVLGLGLDAHDYADHLLKVARSLKASGAMRWTSGLSMARAGELERRFQSILDPRTDHRPMTLGALTRTVFLLFGIAFGCAALSPSDLSASDFIEIWRGRGEIINILDFRPPRVQIRADGVITGYYYGGSITASIPTEQARALIQEARANGFFGLSVSYSEGATDARTDVIRARINGREERLWDHGSAAPLWVQELKKEIDDLADQHLWYGDPQEETFSLLIHLPGGIDRTNLINIWRDSSAPKPGVTDLMRASFKGNGPEVRQLLAAGADVNATDVSGWTALMYATGEETVSALLAAGADHGARSLTGETALMSAVNSPEKTRRLIAAGANVNAQDKSGTTVLMAAAIPDLYLFGPDSEMNKEKRPEALRRAADRTAVLRAAGADPMLRDTKGHSVFDQLAAFAKFAQLSDSDYALLRQSLQ